MTMNLLWGHPDSLHTLTSKNNHPSMHTVHNCAIVGMVVPSLLLGDILLFFCFTCGLKENYIC